MLEWATLPLKRYAEFSGRSRRKEYWFFWLATVIAGVITGFVDGVLGMTGMVGPYGPLTALLYLGVIVPSIAVGVRRMHDSDRSGWWLLLPIVNLVFLLLEGTKGPNRFGPDPKAENSAEVFS